jgi:toxin ParE1/3/4
MARPAALIWTAPALDDLDDIAAWIAIENESAAAALVERTLAAVERLRRFPESGRWVPELSSKIYREVIVPPCRILYRREKSKILIVHVVRGERRLQSERLR